MAFIMIFLLMGIIYILSEIIVNAIDALAHEFKIPEGFTSSVIAALATTLPEFLVPLISFLKGTSATNEIGVSSIFGGPLLLSTLGFFIMLLTIEAKYRAFKDIYDITNLMFFMLSFSVVLLASFIPYKKPTIIVLIFIYIYFVYNQFKSKKTSEEHNEELFLCKLIKLDKRLLAVIQMLFVVVSIYFVIEELVSQIESISHLLDWSNTKGALIFSPIATEAPELFNAIIWARKGKIRQSIGNIAGSLAFQASMPASLGLLFTDWHVPNMLMIGGFLSIISTVLFSLSIAKSINTKVGILAILSIIVVYFIYIL